MHGCFPTSSLSNASQLINIFSSLWNTGGILLPKVTVDIPQELYDDMMEHVGGDKKFVNQSDAIRTAIRKMLDQMDEIDRRHGRLRDKALEE
jgi:hypothetical protein